MVNKDVKERFVRKTFASLVITIIARLGGFVFALVLARMLAPEGYGLYSLALSLALIFYTLTDLGINATIMRYFSYTIKKKISARPYYIYTLKIKSYLTAVFTLILLIAAYPISKYVYNIESLFLPLIAGALYIAIASFESFYTMIFYSLEDVRFISKKEAFVQIAKILSAILVFFVVSPELQVFYIILSLFVIYSIFIVIDLIVLKNVVPDIFKASKEKINKKEVNKYIKYISIATISTALFANLDSAILGLFVQSEFLGYYKAALNLISGLVGVLSFPNLILVSFFSKSTKKDVKAIINKMFYYTGFICLPATLGIIGLSNFIIKAFYGDSYLAASPALAITALSILPWTFVIFIVSFLTAEKETKTFASLVIKATVLNFALIVILASYFNNYSESYAINAASVAIVISWFYYFMGSIKTLKEKFKINVDFRLMIKPLVASLIMFAYLLFTLNFIDDMTMILGAIVIASSMIVYFAMLYIIKGFPSDTITLLKNSFFRK